MRAAFLLFALAIGGIAPAAVAQTAPVPQVQVLNSAAPDHVSVTFYRAPGARPESETDRDDPGGYAVVTETRTVTLPAGTAVIRFEGVAGNILPETAVIAGLPDGVGEKNLDANLLSPRTLFDRALGRRVMVRRTDPVTGKAVLVQATIRSSSAGAAVLQFGNSYSDLWCTGMPEMLVYDGVPEGLSAKPTLSVRTTSARARTVKLTLTYLAGGFDWQADYVVTMRPDGRSADLFAWITLASSDVTSFPDADLQVVAGNIQRVEKEDDDDGGYDKSSTDEDGELTLKCWPRHSYAPTYDLNRPPSVPSPAPPAPMMESAGADIVVTGSRAKTYNSFSALPVSVIASAEMLGDLKLYRFPRRVTVASKAQKQVAMISRPAVKLVPIYQSDVAGDGDWADTKLLLRGKNDSANGLGIALPAGSASVFNRIDGRSMLITETSLPDKTVGEDIELFIGEPDEVDVDIDTIRESGRKTRYELTVTNDNPWPIDYEAKFSLRDGREMLSPSVKLGRKDGGPFWSVRVPAEGSAKLVYTIREPKDEDED